LTQKILSSRRQNSVNISYPLTVQFFPIRQFFCRYQRILSDFTVY